MNEIESYLNLEGNSSIHLHFITVEPLKLTNQDIDVVPAMYVHTLSSVPKKAL